MYKYLALWQRFHRNVLWHQVPLISILSIFVRLCRDENHNRATDWFSLKWFNCVELSDLLLFSLAHFKNVVVERNKLNVLGVFFYRKYLIFLKIQKIKLEKKNCDVKMWNEKWILKENAWWRIIPIDAVFSSCVIAVEKYYDPFSIDLRLFYWTTSDLWEKNWENGLKTISLLALLFIRLLSIL